jgi:sugar-specific transcriptional regulator TrmB
LSIYRNVVFINTEILEDLGFSHAEIKVYLSLLELGSTKAGSVVKTSGLQNFVVHLTLNKLAKKGLVSFVRHRKVKHYSATNPRNFLRFIDEKVHRFEEILQILLEKQQRQEKITPSI